MFLTSLLFAVSALAQTAPLTCDERVNAAAINAGTASMPREIAHFGPLRYIAEDVVARTVPQLAWDRFVMGDGGRWALRPWRRGLYGTRYPLEAAPYGSSAEDGMMLIRIREPCLRPPVIASPAGITSHGAWLPWFHGARGLPFSAREAYERSCFDGEGQPINVSWFHATEGEGPVARPCETMFERFFDEAGIKVVHDPITPGSSYIRDRTCIETIHGTPPEMLRFFAEEPQAWVPGCIQNPFFFVAIRVFLDALMAASVDEQRQYASAALSAMEGAHPDYRRAARAMGCAWARLGPRMGDLISRMRPELQLHRPGSDYPSHEISEQFISALEEVCRIP